MNFTTLSDWINGWILSKMISVEREKRCDDLVLDGHTHPLDYARTLYQLSIHQQSPGYLESAATGNGSSELMSRIERILKPNTMNTNTREKIITILLFSCAVAVLLLVSGFSSGLSITPYNNVTVESTPMPSLIPQSYPDTITPKKAVEEALAGINWEEMKKDMEEVRGKIDLMLEDFDFDFEHDLYVDVDVESDTVIEEYQ